MADRGKELSLYLHIPFCKSRCSYCDFNTYAGIDHLIPAYTDALLKELSIRCKMIERYSLKTIYIGGGTPSYIHPDLLSRVMEQAVKLFAPKEIKEISMESNPGTLSAENLRIYKTHGIDRLSIGMQCWQQPLLNILGRTHTVEDFLKSFKMARNAGFANINTDLIFGIPGQTQRMWTETLKKIIALYPEHISCYSMKLEEGTPLFQQVQSGKCRPVSDEDDRHMYYTAVDLLERAGYRHYEISGFALPGYECIHNMVYWKCGEYLGAGAGAHSYVGGERLENEPDIKRYIDMTGDGKEAVIGRKHIGFEESVSEYMILGLRLVEGVSGKEFKSRFGMDLEQTFGEKINRLEEESLVTMENGNLRLTPKGLDLANRVFVEFI